MRKASSAGSTFTRVSSPSPAKPWVAPAGAMPEDFGTRIARRDDLDALVEFVTAGVATGD